MGDLLFISLATSAVLILSLIWRFFYFFWWRPIKLGRFPKDQGINGPPYWPMVGNIMEETQLRNQAKLRPMDLSHASFPSSIEFPSLMAQVFKTWSMQQWAYFMFQQWMEFSPVKIILSLNHSYVISSVSLIVLSVSPPNDSLLHYW